ncbi:hypothetical protein GDO86_020209, partial [Hymenochirus boettgeri]
PSLAPPLGLCQGVVVDQKPKLMIVKVGDPVKFACRHDDGSYIPALWYQQKPGQGMKLMVYSAGAAMGDTEKGFTSWRLDRPDVLESSLSLESAGSAEAAGYFCAVS